MLSRLVLFPVTTSIQSEGGASSLFIAGYSLTELAEMYGTPLYIYDQATLDQAVLDYRQAFNEAYPSQAGLTYAGKAFLCTAIAQWSQQQGLWLDCSGAGELAIAEAAGVKREHILAHGVNKSLEDLQAALLQAGRLVVDNLRELSRIAEFLTKSDLPSPELWLRLRPGLAVETHAYTQTGQPASKFGMDVQEIRQAVRFCIDNGLHLTGLHFHQGSHFHDPAPLGPAIDLTLDLVQSLRGELGWTPDVICPGGGWGVAYHEDELPNPTIASYVHYVAEKLVYGCNQRDLPLPRLQLEPGRSLVARAGVALYRVGTVKHSADRRWLLLDGGLADNPRPALYAARYSALPVKSPERSPSSPAWLAGPYCESGDVLISGLPMPDVQSGDLVAIPVSGAYQLSMGSNYNGARKPAVVWLDDNGYHLIQRRETLQELTRRDFDLSGNK